jgi:hypothetical protein
MESENATKRFPRFHDTSSAKKQLVDVQVSDLDIVEMSIVSRLCDKDGTQTNMSTEKLSRSAITFSKNFLSAKAQDKTDYNTLIFSAKFLLLSHGKKIEN